MVWYVKPFVAPLQHHIEQSIANVLPRHGQSHQLHAGDMEGVSCRVGELIEPPVTVWEGTGRLSRHGWERELRRVKMGVGELCL